LFPPLTFSATWGPDNTIVWGEWAEGLFKVSANGGARETLTQLDQSRGEIRHGAPVFSADGKLVFFTVHYRDAATDVAVVDLATRSRKILTAGDGAFLFHSSSCLAGVLCSLHPSIGCALPRQATESPSSIFGLSRSGLSFVSSVWT
jgi:hypothetical protein